MDAWNSVNPWVQGASIVYLFIGILYAIEKVMKKEFTILSLNDCILLTFMVMGWLPLFIALAMVKRKKH